MKTALQLWSVKEYIEKDLLQTLEKVQKMGYQGVEFAGYFGNSAETIKQELSRLNLQSAASHIQYQLLFDNLDETLRFEKIIGNHNIVIPYASFETEKEWYDFIDQLKDLAPKIKKTGCQLYYHNHAHEFSQIEGTDILEKMIHEVPDLKLEVDLYWLHFAGVNVMEWVNRNKESIGLIHIKDMQEEPTESTIVGEGILPIDAYISFAKENKLEWIVVEQEAFQEVDSLVAVEKGFNNLTNII